MRLENELKQLEAFTNFERFFLGGLQDAGKTTLVKKIWGVGGKTGYFSHTDGPKLYQVTQKLLVIDFPGSNSLDYHFQF